MAEASAPQDNDTPPRDAIVCQTDGTLWYLEKPESPSGIPSLRSTPAIAQPQATNEYRSILVEQLQSNTKIFVIVSVLSGAHQAGKFATSVLFPLLDVLKLAKGQYQVVETKDAKTIQHFAKETLLKNANSGTSQLVILLSGDGGVIDILNALTPRSDQYQPPQVSLLPMGTGNALANSSGLTDPTYGLSALIRGRPKQLPTFKATFSPGARLLTNEARDEEPLAQDDHDAAFLYGAVVCSWGLHATLVADSDTAEYRKFGAERFKMAANEALHPADGSDPHAYRARVSIREHGSSGGDAGAAAWTDIGRQEHAYVLTTLVSSLEKGFTISPASKPLDGSMRIVHFGPMSGDEIMQLMTLAYQGGKHVHESTVVYEQVDGVRIAFDGLESDGRWRQVCVDGKIIRLESDGWVEVQKLDNSPLLLRQLA